MRRVSLGFIVVLASISLAACGRPDNNGGNDGGSVTDGGGNNTDGGGTTDGGGNTDGGSSKVPGTVTVNSSGNALPPAWNVSDASILDKSGNGAGAMSWQDTWTTLTVSTTVSTTPCALPYTSSSGKTYCDSLNATDGNGNTVVIDTFSFLGTKSSCSKTLPTDGATLTSVSGIWEENYDSKTKTSTWVIAPVDCAGIGMGTPYSGSNQATLTTDIKDLNTAGLTNGQVVTVHGVVTGVWTATTAFGFDIEDPAGGDASGIAVKKGSSSTSTATAPNVGDDVTVMGTVVKAAHRIDL